MKDWYEWCFDRDSFKFRRLTSWSADVDVAPDVAVELAADAEPEAHGMMDTTSMLRFDCMSAFA